MRCFRKRDISLTIRSLALCLLIFLLSNSRVYAQLYAESQFPQEQQTWAPYAFYGTVFGSVGGLYLLADEAYYEDEVVAFHWARRADGDLDWFDNRHRGLDKFGHIYSTSLFSQNLYFLARSGGYGKTRSAWMAAGSAIGIMGAMEVWDAHFENWGFSVGDFTANVLGALFPVVQDRYQLLTAMDYKMSYNFLAEKSDDPGIHDYEHMTFWLTINPYRLIKVGKPAPWYGFINLAIGIGFNGYQKQERELYIALDYNLKQTKVSSALLRHLITLLDRIHFPAPAIKVTPNLVMYGFFF